MPLILLLILILFLIHTWFLWPFFVDDSYITFRYVRQWTHGYGLVYNTGERIEGYSNFLWIVLLAPFDLLNLELVTVSKIAGIFFGLLTIIVTYRLTRKISSGYYAPLLLAVTGPFAAWSVGGLETLLFTCLLTSGVYLFVNEEETGKRWSSALFFGLLVLTRPEGIIFASTAIAYRAWQIYRFKQPFEKRDIVRLLIFLGIVSPYIIWRFMYYGYWLPNTVYAKSMGLSLRPLFEGLVYFYQGIAVFGGFFFIALPVTLTLIHKKSSILVQFVVVNLAVYTIFVLLVGGDWMPMQRFFVHVLPFVYLLVHLGIIELQRIWQNRRAALLVTLLIFCQSGYLLAISILENNFVLNLQRAMAVTSKKNVENSTIAYIRQELRQGETVAVVDAGKISCELPLSTRVIDMVGLTDAHIAHQPAQFPNGLLGRGDGFGKWDIDYVLAQKPRFVQAHLIRQTEESKWVTDFTGTTLLVNDPRFQTSYHLVTSDYIKIFERIDP